MLQKAFSKPCDRWNLIRSASYSIQSPFFTFYQESIVVGCVSEQRSKVKKTFHPTFHLAVREGGEREAFKMNYLITR